MTAAHAFELPEPPKPWTPRGYQELALQLLLQHAGFGLFADMGLGKTSVILAAFKLLRHYGVVERMIVVAPRRPANLVWPVEARTWTDFHGINVHVLHGKGKTLDALLDPSVHVYVVTPDGLAWLEEAGKVAWGQRGKWPQMLVVDESTKYKHTTTQRFKTLRRLLDRFDRRYILSGTPAPNGLLDLFGQVYIIDGGETLGRFVSHYRMRYFQQVGFGGYTWVLRPGAEEEIYDKLKPIALRLDCRDHLDMPEKIETRISVELNEKARRQYDELEKEMVLSLRAGDVVASSAAGLISKCHQFTGGSVYAGDVFDYGPTDKRVAAQVHTDKLEALLDLVDDLQGQPLLVAYSYRHEAEVLRVALQRHLKKREPVRVLGGGTSDAQAEKIVAEWNAGRLPVLLVHPASAGHGLNLQHGGRHLAWYSQTWDLELDEQLAGRLWRQGQRGSVMVYRLIVKNSVDEVIAAAIRKKGRAQGALLEALKERYAADAQSDAVLTEFLKTHVVRGGRIEKRRKKKEQ